MCGNVEDSENEESKQDVNGPSDCIQPVYDDGEAESEVVSTDTYLMVKVMQSMHSVYKLCVSHILGLTPYGDGQNLYSDPNNKKLSLKDLVMGALWSNWYPK